MPLGTGPEPVASEAGETVSVGNRQVRNHPRLNALPQVPEQLALAVRAPADFRQPGSGPGGPGAAAGRGLGAKGPRLHAWQCRVPAVPEDADWGRYVLFRRA